MNYLALYFLAVLLMWKMLHKYSVCQDKELLPREPGTALAVILKDRPEIFYLWTASVLFCLFHGPSFHGHWKFASWSLLWISSERRCGSKQERSPDAFGTIWHHHGSDADDQMFQGMGDLRFAFDCPSVLTRCQSTEMFWLLLLGSCLLLLLQQMIWKLWPFSHVCDIHTIKHTDCQSQLLPRGEGSLVQGEGGTHSSCTCGFFLWGCMMFLRASLTLLWELMGQQIWPR